MYPKPELWKLKKKKKKVSSFPSCHKQGMKAWQRHQSFALCQNELLAHFSNYFKKYTERGKGESIIHWGCRKETVNILGSDKKLHCSLTPKGWTKSSCLLLSAPPVHLLWLAPTLTTEGLRLHSKGKARPPCPLAPFCESNFSHTDT